ncbi:MAG TPA: bifunctional diguanylate cyclase/phosphodiesterase [Polyangiaceae bacterium]|nr:bifunctional diguanylate cyclase/phosphodiesterase [Polyangiaceae bacterium]
MTLDSKHWLLERYWIFAWTILILASPLLFVLGDKRDLWGVGGYVAITLVSRAIAWRASKLGTLIHLHALFPYWTWYARLDGGLPMQLGTGVAEYVMLLVFPILTLVTLEGWRGAGAASALGGAGLIWGWSGMLPRLEGAFLLGMAVIIGIVFRRLARELEAAQARMRHMAFHDDLTSLGNRRLLEDQARQWLSHYDGGCALLFIDLDRFKTVNDVLGQAIGDEILRTAAERIREVVTQPHFATRIGGDEFVVLMRRIESESQARELAESIVACLSEPFATSGRVLHLAASVGIAMWPQHGRDLEGLLRCADLAVQRAKKRGKAVAVHRADHDSQTLTVRALEVDLQRAVERDELELQFQPVVDVGSDEVVGTEALVRWRHPVHGLLAPASFIQLAEETGQILEIDRWVFRRAAAQARVWSEAGYNGWMAVNLSARTLHDEGLVGDLLSVCDAAGVEPRRMVLELTESAAMSDPEASCLRLEQIARIGVRIAIDDFGMGYSSLAYLKRFPASHVKIDKSFTSGIGKHERDEELIELVMQLASKWNLQVIAEGVETSAQRAWLAARGCTLAQGFHLSPPLDASEVLARSLRASGKIGVPDFVRAQGKLRDAG